MSWRVPGWSKGAIWGVSILPSPRGGYFALWWCWQRLGCWDVFSGSNAIDPWWKIQKRLSRRKVMPVTIFTVLKPTYTILKVVLEVICNPTLCISLESSHREDHFGMLVCVQYHCRESLWGFQGLVLTSRGELRGSCPRSRSTCWVTPPCQIMPITLQL